MTSVITSEGLGLFNSSFDLLGNSGKINTGRLGATGGGAYVNAMTGNLVLQQQDEYLVGLGIDTSILRTYNSMGALSGNTADGNQDLFRFSFNRRILWLDGKLIRIGEDGKQTIFENPVVAGTVTTYTSNDGAGAVDTLTYNSSTGEYVWKDGATQSTDKYQFFSAGNYYRLVSTTDADGLVANYTYHTNGLLETITDAAPLASDRQTLRVVYASSTSTQVVRLETVRNGTITQTLVHYQYDTSGRLWQVDVDLTPTNNDASDGKVFRTTYTYDGTSKRVATVTQSDGTFLGIQYVQDAALIYRVSQITRGSINSAEEQRVRYQYDTVNRTTTITQVTNLTTNVGLTTILAYDIDGQLISVRPPEVPGATKTRYYTYDTAGNLKSEIDELGKVTEYRYYPDGNLKEKADALGFVTRYTYNTANQVLTQSQYQVADPDGLDGSGQPASPLTSRYVYHATKLHQLRFSVDAKGFVTEYQYNTLGQLAAKRVYSNAYNLNGLLADQSIAVTTLEAWALTQAQVLSSRTDYVYDFRGQIQHRTEVTDFAAGTGPRTYYIYDQSGRLLKEVSALGVAPLETAATAPTSFAHNTSNFETLYVYDGAGRLLARTDEKGYATTTQYSGNQVIVSDAGGLQTLEVFNAAGQLVSHQESDTASSQIFGTTGYAYNVSGNTLTKTDANGKVSYQVFNARSQLAYDVDAAGYVTEYEYDGNGNVVKTRCYDKPVQILSGETITTALKRLTPEVEWNVGTAGVLDVNASGITKTSATASWYGVMSKDSYQQAVQLEFSFGALNKQARMGLNLSNPVTTMGDIDYSFGVTASSTIVIYENSTSVKTLTIPQKVGNRYRIILENDVVRYYVREEGTTDFVLVHTSTLVVSKNYVYFADGEFLDQGASIKDISLTKMDWQETQFIRDARGLVKFEIDPERYVTEHDYDAQGQVIATRRFENPLPTTGVTYTEAGLKSLLSKSVIWQAPQGAGLVVESNRVYIPDSDTSTAWRSVRSEQTIQDSGSVEFTVDPVGENLAIGLNTNDTTTANTDLDYSINIAATNAITVIEESASRSVGLTHAAGNRYRISLENGVVKYYVKTKFNDFYSLFYTSLVAAPKTSKYFVDTAFSSAGASISNVQLVNSYNAEVSEKRFIRDSNGKVRYEIDAINYVTEYVFDAAGRVGSTRNYDCPVPLIGLAYTETSIQSFLAGIAVWQAPQGQTLVVNGNSINVPDVGSVGNRSIRSEQMLRGSGYVEFTVDSVGKWVAVGLNNADIGTGNHDLNYSININTANQLFVSEENVSSVQLLTHQAGNRYRIAIENGSVKYYVKAVGGSDFVFFYASSVVVDSRLGYFVDAFLFNLGASVSNVLLSPASCQSTRFVYDSRGLVRYQIDAKGYVTEFDYDAKGQVIASRRYATPLPETGVAYTEAGLQAWTGRVKWQEPTGAGGLVVDGDRAYLQRGVVSAFTRGVRSEQVIRGTGYLDFTIDSDRKRVMVGLNLNDTTSSWTDLDYAVHFHTDNQVSVYEEGVGRVGSITHQRGNRYRIALENGVVNYYVKAIGSETFQLFYKSSVAASTAQDYFADTAFHSAGASISNVVLSSAANATFEETRFIRDARGQVQYEVDGEGYVTEYEYDARGQVTLKRRHDYPMQGVSYTQAAIQQFLEAVTWKAPIGEGLVVDGNRVLLRDGMIAGGVWSRNVRTTQSIQGQGAVDFSVISSARDVMVGLNSGSVAVPFTNFHYGIYVNASNGVYVSEGGVNSASSYLTHAAGNRYRIAIEGSVVKYYYQTNASNPFVLFYTSAVAPSASAQYFVDASLYSAGGMIENVTVSNAQNRPVSETRYVRDARGLIRYEVDAKGFVTQSDYDAKGQVITTTLYQRALPSAFTTYTVAGLSQLLSTDTGYQNPSITRFVRDTRGQVQYEVDAKNYVTEYEYDTKGQVIAQSRYQRPIAALTELAPEAVRWGTAQGSNVVISGNSVSLNASAVAGWTHSIRTTDSITGNGFVEFSIPSSSLYVALGLNRSDTAATRDDLEYAFYAQNSSQVSIRENGVNNGLVVADRSAISRYRIELKNGFANYYVQKVGLTAWELVYTSSQQADKKAAYFVDTALYQANDSIINVTISELGQASTTRYVRDDRGQAKYEIDAEGYVTEFAYDAAGQVVSTKKYNESTQSVVVPFIEDGIRSALAQAITWQSPNANVTANGNTLVNSVGTTTWGNGVRSTETIKGSGFIEFDLPANAAPSGAMVGVNSADTSTSSADIDYAFAQAPNGRIEIFEEGVSRGVFAAYKANNRYRIELKNGVARYYVRVEGATEFALVYASLVAVDQSKEYFVDTAFQTVAAQARNVRIYDERQPGSAETQFVRDDRGQIRYEINANGYVTEFEYDAKGNVIRTHKSEVPVPTSVVCSKTGLAQWLTKPESVSWALTFGSVNAAAGSMASTSAVVSGGNSYQTLEGEGYIEFSVLTENKAVVLGLCAFQSTTGYTDIKYGFDITSSGAIRFREHSNLYTLTAPIHRAGNRYRIAVEESNIVRYYIQVMGSSEFSLVRSSTLRSVTSQKFFVDTSLSEIGASVTDIVMSTKGNGKSVAVANTTQFVRDALGHIQYEVDANRYVTQYQYDAAGRVNTTFKYSAPLPTTFINYTVDGIAQALSSNTIYQNPSVTRMIRDNLGQVRFEIDAEGFVKEYEYDARGQVIRQHTSDVPVPLTVPLTEAGLETWLTKPQTVTWTYTFGSVTTGTGTLATNSQVTTAWANGANSHQSLKGEGYIEFSVNTYQGMALGLNTLQSSTGTGDIKYGFDISHTGVISVREGAGLPYTSTLLDRPGTRYRITIEDAGRKVRYYVKASDSATFVQVYESAVVPVAGASYFVDASIGTSGTVITDIVMSNKGNGQSVAAGQTTQFIRDARGQVQREIDAQGYVTEYGYDARGQVVTQNKYLDVLQAPRAITWGTASSTNVVVNSSGVSLSSSAATGWTHSVRSTNSINGNGIVEFGFGALNRNVILGLNRTSTTNSNSDLEFAFYSDLSNGINIWENGVIKAKVGSQNIGDRYRIELKDGAVNYYIRSEGQSVYALVYTSSLKAVKGSAYFVDTAFYQGGGSVTAVVLSDFGLGSVAIRYIRDARGQVQYEIDANRFVTEFKYDAKGQVISSHRYTKDLPATDVEYTSAGLEKYLILEVNWQSPQGTGLVVNERAVTLASGTNGWTHSIRSNQVIKGTGFVEFTLPKEGFPSVFGLNDLDSSTGDSDIDFAFYSHSDKTIHAYMEGTDCATLLTHAEGNRYRIEIQSGVAKLFVKRVGKTKFDFLYTFSRAVNANSSYFVDMSFNTVGASISDVVVSSDLTLARISTHYLRDARGQVRYEIDAEGYVTEFAYDADGKVMSSKKYSNSILIGSVQYTVDQVRSALALAVTWQNPTANVTVTGNTLVHNAATAWGNGVRSDQTIKGNGFIEFDMPVAAKVMVGLNAINTTGSHIDIEYAFFGVNDGRVQIYEKGQYRGDFGTIKAGNRYRIEVNNSVVGYYIREQGSSEFVLVYTARTQVDENKEYFVDTSFEFAGGSASNVRIFDIRQPGNVKTQYVKDELGNTRFEIDNLGYVTESVRDAQGNVVQTIRYATAYPTTVGTPFTEKALAVFASSNASASTNQRTYFVYDKLGQVRFQLNSLGFTQEFEYTAQGQVSRQLSYAKAYTLTNALTETALESWVTKSANRTANQDRINQFFYDDRGSLLYQIDAGGYLTAKTYNAAGQVIEQIRYARTDATLLEDATLTEVQAFAALSINNTAEAKQVTRFFYNDLGQLTFQVDALNYVTEYQYNYQGRVTEEVRYSTAMTGTISETALLALDWTTDNAARVTRYCYDDRGQKTSLSQRLRETSGEKWITETYTYDVSGNRTRITGALGNTTSFVYNKRGELTRKLTPLVGVEQTLTGLRTGTVTDYTYDAFGNRLTEKQYANTVNLFIGTVQRYASDITPSINSDTVMGDRLIEYVYDGLNRLQSLIKRQWVEVRDPVRGTVYDDVVTTNEYDSFGNLKNLTEADGSPLKRVTHFEYNLLNQMIEETKGLPDTSLTTINSRYTQYDRASYFNVSNFTTGGANRVQITQFRYDGFGNVSSTLDARGVALLSSNDIWAQDEREASGWTRDRAALTLADQNEIERRYTRNQEFDAKGQKIGEYRLNELTGESVYSKKSSYDAFGNLITVTDGNNKKGAFVYDTLNRLRYNITPGLTDHSGASFFTEYKYDSVGNMTEEIRYANPHASGSALIDNLNLTPGDVKASFNQTGTESVGSKTNFSFDTLGRLAQKESLISQTGTTSTIAKEKYEYDAMGRMVKKFDAYAFENLPNTTPPTTTPADTAAYLYTYNAAGMLTQRITPQVQVYNSSTQTTQVLSSSIQGPFPSVRVDLSSQTRITDVLGYDAFGNVISENKAGRLTRLKYNKQNQLVRKEDPVSDTFDFDGTTGTSNVGRYLATTYRYDLLGNKLNEEKSARIGAGSQTILGEIRSTEFAYNNLGERILTKLADGSVTIQTLDAVGNISRERKLGILLTTTYNELISGIGDNYRETEKRYDADNRLIASATREEILFDLNKIIRDGSQDPNDAGYYLAAATTRDYYDKVGNLVAVRNANFAMTYYCYNERGDRILEVDPLGYVIEKKYDYAGNLIVEKHYAKKLDGTQIAQVMLGVRQLPEGTPEQDRETRYTYDGLGRRTSEIKKDVIFSEYNSILNKYVSVTQDIVTSMGFNTIGNLIKVTQPDTTEYNYAFDALGRMIDERHVSVRDYVNSSLTARKQVIRRYNSYGEEVERYEQVLLSDNSVRNRRTINKVWNSQGNVIRETDYSDLDTKDCWYNVFGELTKDATYIDDYGLARGVLESNVGDRTIYTHYQRDKLGREIKRVEVDPYTDTVTVGTSTMSNAFESRVFSIKYNAYGDTEGRGEGSKSDGSQFFQEFWIYDKIGRIASTNSQTGVERQYIYDASGNLTLEIKPDANDARIQSGQYVIQSSNVLGKQYIVYRYDKNGQMVDHYQSPLIYSSDELRYNALFHGYQGSMTFNNDHKLKTEIVWTKTPAQDQEINNCTQTDNPWSTQPAPDYAVSSSLSAFNKTWLPSSYALSVDAATGEFVNLNVMNDTKEVLSDVVSGGQRTIQTKETKYVYTPVGGVNPSTELPYGKANIFGNKLSLAKRVWTGPTWDQGYWYFKSDLRFLSESPMATFSVTNKHNGRESYVTDIWRHDSSELIFVSFYAHPKDLKINIGGTEVTVLTDLQRVFASIPNSSETSNNDDLQYTDVQSKRVLELISSNSADRFELTYTVTLPNGSESDITRRLDYVNGGHIELLDDIGNFNQYKPITVREYKNNIVVADYQVVHQRAAVSGQPDKQLIQYKYQAIKLERQYTKTITGDQVDQQNWENSAPEWAKSVEAKHYLRSLAYDFISSKATTDSFATVDPNLIRNSFEYNGFGEMTSSYDAKRSQEVRPDNAVVGLSHISGGAESMFSSPNRTQFVYDKLGNVVEELSPEVSITTAPVNGVLRTTAGSRYYFNKNGQKIAQEDARSIAGLNAGGQSYYTRFEYFEDGSLKSTTDREGNSTVYKTDVFGNVREKINALSEKAVYLPDGSNLDRVSRVELYSASGSRVDINSNGSPDNAEQFSYDDFGNRIKHTNAQGNTEEFLFDRWGRIRRTKSFGNRLTNTFYNWDADLSENTSRASGLTGGAVKTVLNGLYTVVGDTLNHIETGISYFDREVYKIDMGGRETIKSYNKSGLLGMEADARYLSQEVMPARMVNYYYNVNHRNYEITDNGSRAPKVIQYAYYANEKLKTVYDKAQVGLQSYAYDRNGNRIRESALIAPNNYASTQSHRLRFTQDNQNQFMKRLQDSELHYDERNRLVKVEDAQFNVVYTYDANGNQYSVRSRYNQSLDVAGQKQAVKTQSQARTLYYQYDKENRMTLSMGQKKDYRWVNHGTNSNPSYVETLVQPYIDIWDTGYLITYDALGRKTTTTSNKRPQKYDFSRPGGSDYWRSTEYYSYNELGLVTQIAVKSNADTIAATTDNSVPGFPDRRVIKKMSYNVDGQMHGKLTYGLNGDESEFVYTGFDADGAILSEWTFKQKNNLINSNWLNFIWSMDDIAATETSKVSYNYLADGSTLDRVSFTNYEGTDYTVYYDYIYHNRDKFDTFKVSEVTVEGLGDPSVIDNSRWASGTSYYQYDSNGNIRLLLDAHVDRWSYIDTDLSGRVFKRYNTLTSTGEVNYSSNNVVTTRKFYYANDQVIGEVGNDEVASRRDAFESVRRKDSTLDASGDGTGGLTSSLFTVLQEPANEDEDQTVNDFIRNTNQEVNEEDQRVFSTEYSDFDQNYQSVSVGGSVSASSYYETRQGETLASIAQAVWGDSQLWYLLAQANSISSTAVFPSGYRIKIPNVHTNIHNRVDTYRPYDSALGLGDTNPTLPDAPPAPPKQEECGYREALVIVAAIAVAVAAPYLFEVLLPILSPIIAPALGAAAAEFGTAFVVATIGSAATQSVSIGLDLQDGYDFDFQKIAANALAQNLLDGLSGFEYFSQLKETYDFTYSVVQAAIQSALSTQIQKAFGVEDATFQWRDIAVSGLTAAASKYLQLDKYGSYRDALNGGDAIDVTRALGRELTSAVISNSVNELVYRDEYEFNWASTLQDVFTPDSGIEASLSGFVGASYHHVKTDYFDGKSLAVADKQSVTTGAQEKRKNAESPSLAMVGMEPGMMVDTGAASLLGGFTGTEFNDAMRSELGLKTLGYQPGVSFSAGSLMGSSSATLENQDLDFFTHNYLTNDYISRSLDIGYADVASQMRFSGPVDYDALAVGAIQPSYWNGEEFDRFLGSAGDTVSGMYSGFVDWQSDTYDKTSGWGNVFSPITSAVGGVGPLIGNTFGLIGHAMGAPNQRVNQYWGDVWDGVVGFGNLLGSALGGNPEAAGRLAPGVLFGAATYGLSLRLGGLDVPNKTPLTYDVSNWAEYGLPADGTFSRSLRLSEAQDFLAGKSFSFGGRPIEPYKTIDGFVDPGYPGGQGFIGRAEDTASITTKDAYRELYKLEPNQVPEFILDFQLKDPSDLQNVLYAPYKAFERGGKTGAGQPEFNFPAITSDDIVNPVLRKLK